MNIYSHLVIADELKPYIQPDNNQEYYWGAVIPDIRNIAGIRRSQTHLSAEQILNDMGQYQALKSFLQGYLVHCLTDQLDLVSIFNKQFPFFLFKSKLTPQHYPVILELFYLEQKRHVTYTVSGRHNPMLDALGITPEQSQMYYQLISKYLANQSFEAAIITAQCRAHLF